MNIKVKIFSDQKRAIYINLEEIGILPQDWAALTEQEQQEIILLYIQENTERPKWVLDKIEPI